MWVEDQESVAVWAAETFGRAAPVRLVARAGLDAGELLDLVTGPELGTPEEFAEAVALKAADVAIVLWTLLDRVGVRSCRAQLRDLGSGWAAGETVLSMIGRVQLRLAGALIEMGRRRPNENTIVAGADIGLAHLYRICFAIGRDLDQAVDIKMAINRSRDWVRDGTGCGRHMEG